MIETLTTKARERKLLFEDKLRKFQKLSSKPVIDEKLVILSFISGIILSLSMPGSELSFIAWVGFIPLLFCIKKSGLLKASLTYSFFFGLGFNCLNLRWITGLHPLGWLGFSDFQSFCFVGLIYLYVITYASLVWGFLGLYLHSVFNLDLGITRKSILVALGWSFIMNGLMSLGEFAFPWSMIEYSQYKNLELLQFAQFIGGIGIGSLIVFTNSYLGLTLFSYIEKKLRPSVLFFRLLVPVLCFSALFFGGRWILNNSKPFSIVPASVVQTNITVEKEKVAAYSVKDAKNSVLHMIMSAPSGVVATPEAMIYEFLKDDDKSFYDALDYLSRDDVKTLVIGTLNKDINSDDTYSPTNSAIVFDKNIYDDNIYNKRYIVPFGEYIPLAGFIPDCLKKMVLSTVAQTDFKRGQSAVVIPACWGKIAPSICYDILFPNLTAAQCRKGANILVNSSNLSWFRDTNIKEQFIAFGVLRATESRKPVIMGINTGSSAIIDFTGKILVKMPKNTQGVRSSNVGVENGKTIFSKVLF